MDMPPYLKRSGNYLYLQKRVPTDIVRQIPPEIRKERLGTAGQIVKVYLGSDPKAAKQRAPSELSKLEDTFAALRSNGPVLKRSEVTTEALEAMAWRVLTETREAVESGLKATDRIDFEQIELAWDATLEPWRDGLCHDGWSRETTARTIFELRHHGIDLPEASLPFHQARCLVARAVLEAHEVVLHRLHGDLGYQPSIPKRDVSEVGKTVNGVAPSITEIHQRWEAERNPPPLTRMEWKRAIELLVQMIGDKPIDAVSGDDVRAFKDALLLMPTSMSKRYPGKTLPEVIELTRASGTVERVAAATITKYLNAVKSVFSWAVANRYLAASPFARITVNRRGEGKTRLSFDADDLTKLFGSPIFTADERPKGGAGEAAKWLPLLGLFTGARLEELGQSLVSDVREDEGIWYIDINELDEGKSLKTESSRRKIPLHPELIECGFLSYVSSLKSGSLFPDLKTDSNGRNTANWSKWFNRYKVEVGVTIPTKAKKDFHSFRHGFKDACRAARIEEEVHDALTGHASASVGRRYGSDGVPLKIRAEAIAKIRFPGLDLSHLKMG